MTALPKATFQSEYFAIVQLCNIFGPIVAQHSPMEHTVGTFF
jgi:hypothetical protein